MRHILFLSVVMILLASCRDRDELLGEPLRSEPGFAPAPTMATIVPGCETRDLEQWYEVVSVNAQAFRDESFGFAAVSPEAAFSAVNRLSDLRDKINQTAVPECMATLMGMLQEIMDTTIDSFYAYNQGQIDQAAMLETVTAQHARYDTEAKPALDNALQNLDQRLQEGR